MGNDMQAEASGKIYVKEPTDIESIETEPQEVIAYDLLGRKTKNPTRGIYIINGRKVLIE